MNHRQNGFAAIAAIFVLVVLAAMGGFMVTFSNTQQVTSAQDIQGVRAYWAARAGMEWAVARVRADITRCTSTSPAAMAGAPVSIEGFAVTIQCSQTTYQETLFTSVRIFRFNVVATQGAGSTRVERSVSASMEF